MSTVLPDQPPPTASTVGLTRRLWREALRPYKGRLALALICMALAAGAQGFSAWLMQPIVDWVFTQKNTALLWPVAGAVLATFAVKGAADYAQNVLMNYVGQSVVASLQKRLYAHLLTLDAGFFSRISPGRLVSRFLVDINQMRSGVSTALTGIGKDSLTVVALIGVMFYQDWILALASFFAFPLAIYPITRLGKRMRKVTVNAQEHLGAFNTILEQSFHGIRMVKAYALENHERGKIGELTDIILGISMKAARTRALAGPIMEFLGGAAVTVVIVYGGSRVISGATTTGAFFSFITALLMAYQPMKSLAKLNTSLQEGLAGAQRLYQLLDTKTEIIEKPDAAPLTVTGGHILFDNVSFSYGDDVPAIHALTLDVPAGKTAALVGPSGAGKSTLLNLIPRFYDISDGQISIDGQDIRDVTLDSLRGLTALVSQEVVLFDDSVRANIAFGRPDASDAEIEDAARMAAAHDFIQALPNGYDTIVGQRGLRLSGGQRQRIAIARAMLKNAPLLLLDEATSALDTESERQVQSALETLMAGRTTLVIAHRLSTIVNADVIHVIDAGRVIESGSHDHLLALNGAYASLYRLQFAREAEAEPVATPAGD